MTPERRHQVESLCLEALDQDPSARGTFLHGRCGTDDELRREVEALLAAERDAAAFLEEPASLERAAPLPPGTRFGPYVIEGVAGSGGMGEVYKAHDTRLGRTVAIKVLSPLLAADPARRERFEREARAASALNHPHICTLHDIGVDHGEVFLVMEFLEGETLAECLKKGPLPIQRALTIATDIADALSAAHRHGVIHRDLKPGNVMLTKAGAKLLDFGLAKLTGDGEQVAAAHLLAVATRSAPLTAEGAFAGTPPYMAPEQLEGKPADARTDLWALGAILYEMVTGSRAFEGTSAASVIGNILNAEPPPRPRAVRPAIPRSVDVIVVRAMRKNPADRYPSAAELLADLERLEAGQLARRVPLFAALRRPVAIVVLAVLALGAVTAVALDRRARARERWVRDTAIPEASALLARGDAHAFAAMRLLQRAEALTPDNPQVRELLREGSTVTRVSTDPPGADVFIRDFRDPADQWKHLGRAPLTARVPTGTVFLWKVSLEGFLTEVRIGYGDPENRLSLVPAAGAPPGMVLVPGGTEDLSSSPAARLDAFWIDATEVTNRAFVAFVESGGYARMEYWSDVPPGTLATFVDKTGRQGPAIWTAGSPPDGLEDHPVGGVSAYEAAAYCRSVGKDLPTLFHWYHAASPAMTTQWAPLSNFQSAGTEPVGRALHLNANGTFDMAGNVREWTRTDTGAGARYTLGGSFSEPSYTFLDPWSEPPLARGDHLGFRCVKYTTPLSGRLLSPVPVPFRDYSGETPVGDDAFATLLRFYDYDQRRPLDARRHSVDSHAIQYTLEEVSFAAAYGTERVRAFLLLPKNARPPYQAVVWFGASGFFTGGDFSLDAELTWLVYLVRSGRAVVFPEYMGSFERRLGASGLTIHEGPIWRELIVYSALDLRRTIDYLETRDDIDARRIAYYGLSFGAGAGGIMTAVESRFGASILVGGGLYPWKRPTEVDVINFLPRVRVPTLMINGEHDAYFNLRGSQQPMVRWLGAKEQHHLVLPSGHVPSERDRWVGAILTWLDKYLGPVQRQP